MILATKKRAATIAVMAGVGSPESPKAKSMKKVFEYPCTQPVIIARPKRLSAYVMGSDFLRYFFMAAGCC